MEIFNFNFKPTLFKELRDEVNDNKNRGNTALKSHYQYIRQIDFIKTILQCLTPWLYSQ